MRIGTFNVQNLRLRQDSSGVHFDGARDEIVALSKLGAADRACDLADRNLTARLIAMASPDLLALQEVYDQRTLDAFHDDYLAPLGVHWPHRICIPGNDGRRHVAIMSRHPLDNVTSHAALNYADVNLAPPPGIAPTARIFRRDCLSATCAGVLIMVTHFKAPADEASMAVCKLEARAVRKLIDRQFNSPLTADWLALGDFNQGDVPGDAVLAPLTDAFAHDLGAGLPSAEPWTYFHPAQDSYSRPDRILASPALAARCSTLRIWRQGVSRAAAAYSGLRLEGVGEIRPRASDHALLTIDLAG